MRDALFRLKLSPRLSLQSLSSLLTISSKLLRNDLLLSSLKPRGQFEVGVSLRTLLLSGVRGSSGSFFSLSLISGVTFAEIDSLGAGSFSVSLGEGLGEGAGARIGTSVGAANGEDSPKSLANQACSTHCVAVSLSL
ncbi:unnamed protein product, partial [Nesidiocoris tenuis]